MVETIEEKIKGTCLKCKHKGEFVYAGMQEGFKDIKDFPVYTCPGCNSTISIASIRRVR